VSLLTKAVFTGCAAVSTVAVPWVAAEASADAMVNVGTGCSGSSPDAGMGSFHSTTLPSL